MDMIQAVIDFIFDNIAIVVWLLIIAFGVASASRKKKQAEERRQQDSGSAKGFKDILAEIEEELKNEEEYEERKADPQPYCPMAQEDDRRGRPYVTTDKAPQQTFTKKDAPWIVETEAVKAEKPFSVPKPPKPNVAPVAMEIGSDLPPKTDALDCPKKDFSRAGLVQAVVMSEILGKPKSLQDESY